MRLALWGLWAIAYSTSLLNAGLSWHNWREGRTERALWFGRYACGWILTSTFIGGLAVVTS